MTSFATTSMILRFKALWLPGIVLLLLVRMMSLAPLQLVIPDHDDPHDFERKVQDLQLELSRERAEVKQLKEAKAAGPPQIIMTQQIPPLLTPTSRWCESDEITNGQWVPVTLPRPPYMPISPRVRCPPKNNSYTPFHTYEWRPHGCVLADWNASQLLQLLANQTLLLVGDSTSLEHYGSLVHLLGDIARLPPRAVRKGRILRYICHDNHNKTGDCTHVNFHTDFYLTNLTDALAGHGAFPTVVVLNRGAHYQPDDQVLDDLKTYTLPALLEWNEQCGRRSGLEHNPNHNNHKCRLLWRTTVPGHPYCGNFTQPATNVTEMEEWIQEQSTKDETLYRKGEYHWQDFQRQNGFLRQLLVETWKPALTHVDVSILDSYRPNILRPDNHRAHLDDCLHTCSPGGGSDLNTQWLLHLLLLRQQQEQLPQQEQQQQ